MQASKIRPQLTTEVTERERAGREISRRCATEGMVLLKNNNMLPLAAGMKIALFGQGATQTIKGGTGSGDVNSRNTVSLRDGLRNAGYQLVNEAWLDQYETSYRESMNRWYASLFEAAGPERNVEKFYHAHSATHPELPEMEIREADVQDAEAVIYVISRNSGEGADRRAEPGDYELDEKEQKELETLAEIGKPLVVVLNVGGVMDLSFLDEMRVDALLLMSQAGCESGNAAADVLSGKVNPSGRLTDSWAEHYLDYPSSEHFSHRDGNLIEEYYTDGIYVGYRYFDAFGVKPRFPFGFGLSYTTFETEAREAKLEGGAVTLAVRVRNTGTCAGKQVVQVYAACPDGALKTERKRLAAFGKTGLLAPGGEEELKIRFPLNALASYHERRAAWILQEGLYGICLGENAESLQPAVCLKMGETAVLDQVTNICELKEMLKEIRPETDKEPIREADFPLGTLDIGKAAESQAQENARRRTERKDRPVLEQAKAIVKKMSLEEKAALVVGRMSRNSRVTIGSAAQAVPGAAGETVGYPAYGIPTTVLADGPAGLRLEDQFDVDPKTGEIHQPKDHFEWLETRFMGKKITLEGGETHYQYTTAIPIGTLIAQSFDTGLAEELGELIAREMMVFGVDVWLAPGMNIHRNPLCGRNFEYYSEDPLVTGAMAAAITRGVQKTPGLKVSIKHFACNNQEDNRSHVSAVITERALREIYLKGFEIAVKTAQPGTIMTSYNRINAVHSANNRDLCTVAAREEWGFEGYIMTDWGTTNRGGSQAAKCIVAGNDLVMPGNQSDIQEIMDAVEGRRLPVLTEERLDESAVRLVAAALEAN